MDNGVRASFPGFQKVPGTTTYPNSATGRRTTCIVPRSRQSGSSFSTDPRRWQWTTTYILHQQSTTRVRTKLSKNRKICLYSHTHISTTSPIFPSPHHQGSDQPDHKRHFTENRLSKKNLVMGSRVVRIRPSIRSSDSHQITIPGRLHCKIYRHTRNPHIMEPLRGQFLK